MGMHNRKITLIFFIVLVILLALFFPWPNLRNISKDSIPEIPKNISTTQNEIKYFIEPINSANQRITHKPFGIKVSPQNSPIQPEKFSGYHTGVDFEIFPEEKNVVVPVFAICEGKLLIKKQARGYGGLIIQSCRLNNDNVTVIYGHLDIASVTKEVGEDFYAGEQIGILGTGFSIETDGERKHLHLGIHMGNSVDTRGYVQDSDELKNWINFSKYL